MKRPPLLAILVLTLLASGARGEELGPVTNPSGLDAALYGEAAGYPAGTRAEM